ncbi:MAG: rhodanese-related sulfurtransferase [Hyphomicrobiales bacterium]|nr:rhodanese-related sulfurtransferase [Hyphomicrobiales bacterium]MDE2113670.1 rhodanese-related sulfurtransferase [Hyphomicrobiales bacterium]
MNHIEINAFYRFAPLRDPAGLRELIAGLCQRLDLCGILLVASEGINGTVAGTPEAMTQFREGIASICEIEPLEPRVSHADRKPFLRMKVRLKAEIVTLGVQGVDPREKVGHYVAPQDWNALISDPDVILIDTRNDFEVELGSFKGAINPHTETFGELPQYVASQLAANKDRKIAMFCTGGIRCEKATSFLLGEGFSNVYHLQGGILKYLEEVPEQESLWHGACFVFDERVGLEHGLKPTDLSLCHGCRAPLSARDRASPLYEHGVTCPRCHNMLSPAQKASARERQKQVNLAARRGQRHIGPRVKVSCEG